MPRSTDGRWDQVCARPGCGNLFSAATPQQLYCSQACANRASPGVGGRKPASGLPERECPTCHELFQPYRATQRACSRKCYVEIPEVRERYREGDKRPARRARQNKLRRERANTPQQNRTQALRRAGWTVEEYDQAYAEQWGCCAICGKAAKGGKTASSRLHADHDHKTGRRRALLCINCNVGIGMFDDDPDLLLAAINYIFLYRGQAAVTLGRSSSGGQSPRSAGN